MVHIFSKTTNDVGVLKYTATGKQQQYISDGFTHTHTLSIQNELNAFRNELFRAILAERIIISSANEHAMFRDYIEK